MQIEGYKDTTFLSIKDIWMTMKMCIRGWTDKYPRFISSFIADLQYLRSANRALQLVHSHNGGFRRKKQESILKLNLKVQLEF